MLVGTWNAVIPTTASKHLWREVSGEIHLLGRVTQGKLQGFRDETAVRFS
jgi:hypothetical protein